MGFNINKTITTELSWEDVALLNVTLGEYVRLHEGHAEEEIITRAKHLSQRLSEELYNCPQDEPNGH